MQLNTNWETLKQFLDDKSLIPQYLDIGNEYIIVAIDGAFSLSCRIIKDGGADQVEFDDNYKPNANKQIVKHTQVQGIPKVSIYKPEGSSSTIVSHVWTDPSSWYTKSTRVTGETLSLVAGKIYDFANPNVIDLTHGRMYAENDITGYELKVYDNGTLTTEDTDYTMNYESGQVTFDAGYTVTGPITADYSHESGSEWTLKPLANKILHIEHAEIQFTKNVVMSPISFEIWVYNPADLPNKIPYQKIVYKNIKDVINASNLGQGFIPALDVLGQDILVFPFNYATIKSLRDADGAELRIKILNDTKFQGEWATATFYVLSQDQ